MPYNNNDKFSNKNRKNNNFSSSKSGENNRNSRDNRDSDYQGRDNKFNKTNKFGNDNPQKSGFNKNSRDYNSERKFDKDSEYNKNKRQYNVSDDDYDNEGDTSLIIGRNPVIEALKAKKNIDILYVNSEGGGSLGLICKMAVEQGIVVKQVSDIKLSAMSAGASHQGVIASGACAEYVTIEEIMDISKQKGQPAFIIICDEIEDPHNLGAIIRTAEAAGADGIIIPKRRSASLNRTVFKTSAGAASWLPVARVSNIVSAIETLKKNGIWIYGTDAKGEDYTKTDLTGNAAFVIGSEGFGIGRLVEEKCDFLVKLPMNGKITSLNASVAAGVFMYEAVRQRALKK